LLSISGIIIITSVVQEAFAFLFFWSFVKKRIPYEDKIGYYIVNGDVCPFFVMSEYLSGLFVFSRTEL